MELRAIEAPRPAVEGPSVWCRKDVEDPSKWVRQLSSEQVRELDAALGAVRTRNVDIAEITPESFPLPSWAQLVRSVRQSLSDGHGFALIRGVPVERYTYEEAKLAYWGIGSHFGRGITQSERADLICDITDRGPVKNFDRTYGTTQDLFFHNDRSDMVALLCLRRSKSGGASLVVSAAMVYNAIREKHPELLPLLMEGFPWDRRNEHGPDESPIGQRVPVFSLIKGRVHCRYGKGALLAAAKRMGTSLTPAERQAIDLVNDTAHDLALSMDFQPGDIQLLNNYLTLHARTAYEDHPEPDRKRHLLRLWLEDDAYRYINHLPLVRYGVLRHGKMGLTAHELRRLS